MSTKINQNQPVRLKKNSHEYIGSVFLTFEDSFILCKKDAFTILYNNLPSYSDVLGNGKLSESITNPEDIKSMMEITKAKTLVFTEKHVPKKAKKEEVDKKIEQIELFNLDNLN